MIISLQDTSNKRPFRAHHIRCKIAKKTAGTTRSSEPTLHLRLNTTIPGMVDGRCFPTDKWIQNSAEFNHLIPETPQANTSKPSVETPCIVPSDKKVNLRSRMRFILHVDKLSVMIIMGRDACRQLPVTSAVTHCSSSRSSS